MHININFILLQEFDVEYYYICFILILKVEFISNMKWKCLFSEISPQSNALREVITPSTKLPAGLPDRATGQTGRLCPRRGRLPSEAELTMFPRNLAGPFSQRCENHKTSNTLGSRMLAKTSGQGQ